MRCAVRVVQVHLHDQMNPKERQSTAEHALVVQHQLAALRDFRGLEEEEEEERKPPRYSKKTEPHTHTHTSQVRAGSPFIAFCFVVYFFEMLRFWRI